MCLAVFGRPTMLTTVVPNVWATQRLKCRWKQRCANGGGVLCHVPGAGSGQQTAAGGSPEAGGEVDNTAGVHPGLVGTRSGSCLPHSSKVAPLPGAHSAVKMVVPAPFPGCPIVCVVGAPLLLVPRRLRCRRSPLLQ